MLASGETWLVEDGTEELGAPALGDEGVLEGDSDDGFGGEGASWLLSGFRAELGGRRMRSQ